MSKSATKDPHYRKILEALDGPLDPHLFEECAQDLLRDVYPYLVPIPGGDDAGMDGAIADGEGEAYPLVATTDQSPIRNLTRSLDSYSEAGGERRKVVMATSTELSPRQRRNLEERAREQGFTLVQLFEQRALADRFYRCSRWAKELLGVTGRPAALSAVPVSRRPLREDVELIGRSDDLAWLRDTPGDRILVGQPGSGKTFLALQLVREGQALFLTDDDSTNIANAVRDLEPSVIVVDDAHVDLGQLEELHRLRREVHADFEILAITWPGQEDDVAAALGELPSSQIRKLEGLTRREIVEVLHGLGIRLPDDDPHLRHLVAQTANKPGLAVTLGSLWLRGEWGDIVSGRAIRQSLIPTLKRVLEADPVPLLACFALGGAGGVEMEVVREFLELDRNTMHRRTTAASHGGVLTVNRYSRDRQCLVVEPEALRAPLLQEVFFGDGPTLPWRDLLGRVEDRSAAIDGLATAAFRGMEIPRDELRGLVGAAGTARAWEELAYLDEGEARWVLENSPRLKDVANACLERAPRHTVQRLLEEAAQGPTESGNQGHQEWPLQLLREWVQELTDDSVFVEQSLARRRLVIEEALCSVDRDEGRRVALHACFVALTPKLYRTRLAFSNTRAVTRFGLLPVSAVAEVSDLWEQVSSEISEEHYDREVWRQLEEMIRQWAKPKVFSDSELDSGALSEEDFAAYRSIAAQMLEALTPLSKEHPGVAVLLGDLSQSIDLDLALTGDADFELLYSSPPAVDPAQYLEERRKREEKIRAFAEDWRRRPPEDVARQLQEYRREAERFLAPGAGLHHLHVLYRELARLVEVPVVWIGALIKHEVPPDFLAPFLERVLDDGTALDEVIQKCLDHPKYAAAGAIAALQAEDLQPQILNLALAAVFPHDVLDSCIRQALPPATLSRLLLHPRKETSIAAVIGEWIAEPGETIRGEVETEWRRAVLRMGQPLASHLQSLTPCLARIFTAHPDLAAEWLRQRMEQPDPLEQPEHGGLHLAALQALDEDQRTELLTYSEKNHLTKALVPSLVGQSSQLYRELLRQTGDRQLQLEPLAGQAPDDNWAKLARLALTAGHCPAEIAQAAFKPRLMGVGGRVGSVVEHWERYRQGFEHLRDTAEGALREVARFGLQEAEKRIEEGRKQERGFALTGQFRQADSPRP